MIRETRDTGLIDNKTLMMESFIAVSVLLHFLTNFLTMREMTREQNALFLSHFKSHFNWVYKHVRIIGV